MAGTAQEALIAELLGDVGLLHDQIKALRDILPDAVDSLDEQTSTAIAAIDNQIDQLRKDALAFRQDASALLTSVKATAAKIGEATAEQASEKEAEKLQKLAERLSQRIVDAAQESVATAVRAPATDAISGVTTAMRRVTDASDALSKAADQLRGRRWEIAAWCSGAALLGGLVGGALVLIAPKGGMVARLDQIQATIYEIQAAPRPGTVQSKPPRK